MREATGLLLAGCLLLAACGGGGGDVASTGAPPVAPEATLLPLDKSMSFATITASIDRPGSDSTRNETGGFVTRARDGLLTFSYDPASATYSVQNDTSAVSFGRADAQSTSDYVTSFSRTSGTATDTLAVYANIRSDAAGAAPLQLSYTSFGRWTHTDSAGRPSFLSYFLFGQPTGADNLPRTGSASYQTIVTATMPQTPLFGALFVPVAGSATFSADFAAGTVGTVLTLGRETFNGTGSIGGDQFAGKFTSNAVNFTGGSFAGGFFGPAAKEMGYAFTLHKYNPDPYAGAALVPFNTYLTGVVVGRKQ